MKLKISALENYLSCCLCCGSFWTDEGFLCQACVKILSRYQSKDVHQVRGLPVYSLYDWVPETSDALSRLLLHTKKANLKSAWKQNALKLTQGGPFQKSFTDARRRLFVVPAPPKVPGGKDHAYRWAESLALALGAELVPCLKRRPGDSKEQKRRSLYERSNLHLEIDENYSEWPSYMTGGLWIFADDIVTTGSTALAAYQALGSPTHFQVLALGYRRLSCGSSKNLL